MLHLDSPILRLDAERTVPALRATLVLDEDGLRMDFAVDRATLIGMKESSFGASIDPVQVMTWPADRPVWVTARPGPELAQRVQQALASGQGLEQLAAEKSSAGFPLLLDLEGYRLVRVLRETGSSTVPGEVER